MTEADTDLESSDAAQRDVAGRRSRRLADVDHTPDPLLDTTHNMPGDQPAHVRGPNKSRLQGTI